MDWDAILAGLGAIGLKAVNVIAGAVASFAALRFFAGLSTFEKWSTFLGGWAVASWGAGPLREYLELKPGVEVGIVLVLGLFGMAVSAELIKLVRDTDWKGLLRQVFDVLLHRKSGGNEPPKGG